MPLETLADPSADTQRSPLDTLGAPPDHAASGFFESTVLSVRTATLAGQLAFEALPRAVDALIDREHEPGFDPYDPKQFNNAEFFQEHPYMRGPFVDGTVADIPNSGRFWNFVNRQEEDYRLRTRLGQAGTFTQLAAGTTATIADMAALSLLGGVATPARAAEAVGAPMKAVGAWAKEGGYLAQAAKSAAVAGTVNLAYDQTQHLLNPNRNVDEWSAAAWSFGTGVAIGAAIPLFLGGVNGVGKARDSAAVLRSQQLASEMQSSPVFTDIVEAGKADAKIQYDAALSQPDLHPAPGAESVADAPTVAMGAASPEISTGNPAATAPTEARQFTILDIPENAKTIADLKARFPDAVFHEHPMQAMVNLQKTLADVRPIELGPVGNAMAKVFGFFSPGGKLADAPSLRARMASRLFFDYSRPAAEVGESPVSGASHIPAEGHRDIYQGWHDTAAREMDAAWQAGKAAKDGTPANRDAFFVAVTDYMRAVKDLERNPGHTPEAPASVKTAAKALADYRLKIGQELKDVGILPPDTDLATASHDLMRRYLAPQILRNQADFIARLVEQQRVNRLRDFTTGEPIEPLSRPIEEGVLDHARKGRDEGDLGLTQQERDRIRALAKPSEVGAKGKLSDVTEGAIHAADPALYQRYLEEVNIHHQRRAESLTKDILGLGNEHGVTNPLRERVVQMDETRFLPYLDRNAADILDTYHHVVGGRLAGRRAVMEQAEAWSESVKRATGKDLKAENYDPQLILQTVKHDFNEWIKALKDEPKAQAKMETAQARTMTMLEAKVAELEGRSLFPNNPSAGAGWQLLKFADKALGRLTGMSFLGKAAIANIGDAAAGSFFKNLKGRQASSIIDALNLFKDAPTRDIEAHYVAFMDMARTIRDADLGDIPGDQLRQPYGPGTLGKVLTAADTGLNAAYDAFVSATGLRRVTSNQSRHFAHLVQQEVIAIAKKMAAADRLIKESGMSDAKAMKAVGLVPLDAQRMNRLGMNGARSARLIAQLDKHGLDFDGNPVTTAHDGYIAPQMSKWAKSDGDLFRAFNFAVNSEVQNLILRPKLGSTVVRDGSWQSRLLKYVNMFQSFTFSWGNQLLPLAAQRPGYEVARYVGLSVGAAAIADSLYARLTGKRSFDESAQAWQSKPLGMLYAAVNRSPLLGWLQRPIGALESTGFGPAKMAGIELSSVYGRRDVDVGDIVLGPAYSWMKNLTKATVQSLRDPGYWDSKGSRQLWNTLPFHNWWGIEGFNRAAEAMGYGTPVGPTPIPTRMSH